METQNLLYLKCTIAILMTFWNLNETFASRQCPNQDTILPCRCLVRGEEYQIWCTHSDFPSVLNGLKSLGEHIKDPIDELILENNYLPSLPGRIFSSLRVLRLMLRHNGLERVSSDWLTGLESILVEVFLVEPQLRSIPDDAFSKLKALQAVTIQTKLMKHLPLFSGLIKLRYIQIDSESLLQLSPSNFKNNDKLERLHISSSPLLSKLEANTFVDLPKLELINITNCGLDWIHSRAFARLPALRELILIGNKIADAGMVGQATRELPMLEIIRLDFNNINKLDEASFVDMPKVTEIHVSDNKISEILFGAFHKLPNLTKLNLNRNFIKYIHPEIFLQDVPNNLEELLLVDNRISHIKELRSVLNSLPRLLFLDLSFNNLKSIPFGGFRGHPTLEQLDLSFNKINVIEKEAFMAMPALRELRLRNNSLFELMQQPFWNLPALKGLDLSENSFRRIGPRLLLNLPSLRRLDLHGNNLNMIDPDSLLPVPALEHINISYNSLEILHPATFRPLLHLYELDVSYNRLLHFVPGLPRGIENLHLHHNYIQEVPRLPSPDLDLPALKMIDLRYNKLEMLYKKSFTTMPQLRKIYLGSNLLHSLDESAFHGLERLEVIDLKENRLANIHPFIFKQLKSLKTLDLSNNYMEILTKDLLKEASNINHLDISKNKLSEILPNTFENNLHIQSLDASNNVLVQLPKSLSNLINLKKLDLANNRIKNLGRDILQGLKNLRELRLSKNYIQELKSETFAQIKFIKSLQIDNNELIYIEPNSFQVLPSLKSIKLDKNKIIEIPNLAFNRLPSLQILELQDNDIRTIAPKAFNLLPQLLMLNLSNNKIMNIDDAGLRTVNSIEVLDLSFNRISRLPSSVFERMEWIVELRMDNNNICGLHGQEFVNMPRLRVLSLRNNKMSSFPEEAIQRQRSNIAVLDLQGNTLMCTCDLIWLQLWLRETSQTSPRCSDGAPLAEVPLSRENCRNKQLPFTTAPGCETELLTSSANKNNPHISNHLVSLMNATKEKLTNKNSVALNPQESDYFYDEYVDYPFNDTQVVETLMNDLKNKDHEKLQLTTSQPHNISGDTPTLYAMSKNKSKTIPSRIPDSPSTSGFSFFGIPLAGINLNKILQEGVQRLGNKTTQPSAERKSAIMNRPTQDFPNKFSGTRNNQMQHPSQVNNKNFYNVRNAYPPTIPEFQNGFIPILPGIGGFKPIPNPNLPQIENRNVTVMNRKDSVDTKLNNTVPKNHRNDIIEQEITTPPSKQENIVNHTLPTPIQLPHSTQNITENVASQSAININQTDFEVNEPTKKNKESKVFETQTHTKSEITFLEKSEYLNISKDGVGPVQSSKTSWKVEKRHNISKVSDLEETSKETTTENYIATSILPLKTRQPMSTTEAILLTAANEEYTEKITTVPTKIIEKSHQENLTEKILAAEKPKITPLSTFLAPGGERPPLIKNPVKSTITKVPSPYLESKQNFKQSLEVSDPLPHRDEEKNISCNSEVEMITEMSSINNDWYFENYNKTNIEPFIALISNSISKHVQVASYTLTFTTTILFLLS